MNELPRHLTLEDLRGGFQHLAGRLDIFLDGELMHRVTRYDIDKGEIDRLMTDEAGDFVLNEARDAVKIETLHGNVAVQLRHAGQCHA